jgi:hypothetical protein
MTDQTPKPLRVLSLGAGVQSSTLLLMALRREIAPFDHVIYADTGWESAEVYRQVDWLEGLCRDAGVPFHRVGDGSIREDVLDASKKFYSMPLHLLNPEGRKDGILRRQCSRRYKMTPVLKKLRELAGLQRYQRSKDTLVECVLGISLDEVQRMRGGEFPWVRNVYELVDLGMTRDDCLAWCRERGYAEPPRSACLGCPLKSDREWAKVRAIPEEWADVVAFDEALRAPGTRLASLLKGKAYLHRSLRPISEVEPAGDEGGMGGECTGMCGV